MVQLLTMSWVLPVLCGTVVCILWMLLEHRKEVLEVQLKQSLVDRGMSADEIVRILQSGGSPPPASKKPPVKVLPETGYEKPPIQKASL